jgi:crotonobetainyl-CoA:carnitine CoA-transferase CaiB-like acyl-CoA transferase
MPEGPLADVHVVEETAGLAGGFAGFLLAALGAEVVWREPPGRAATADVLHRDKRVAPAARALRETLLAGADVLLADESAAEPAALDGQVACRVALWGRDGHPAALPPDEALVAAATGLHAQQWSWSRRPVWLVTPMISYMTGVLGALGTVAALLARRRGATGQRVEADGLHAAMALNAGTYVRGAGQQGSLSQGGDPRGVYPNYGLYRAADGWLFVGALTPAFWVKLVSVLGREELLADPPLQGHPFTFGAPETRALVRAALDPVFVTRPVAAWIAALREADVPCGPVRTRAEALRDPEARALGILVPGGSAWQPGAPAVFSDTPLPAPGVESTPVAADVAAGWRPPPSSSTGGPPAALAGIRVLDLTSFIAGPFCPLLLADLGADVVKIEAPEGDPFRMAAYAFVGWNRGKRSLVLDLKRPAARDVLLDLARGADVVADNFRGGVMDRLGIGWDALRAVNPRLVHLSISGYGQAGALASLPGFDPVFQARSGLMAAQGGLDAPVFHMVAYNDYMAGALGALCATAALFARERTGRGQRIDVSLFRTSYVAQAAELTRSAGGGPDFAGPSAGERLYPSRDGWLCIAARTPAAREALARLAGVTLEGGDPADGAGAAAVARMLAGVSRAEALMRLAAAGVPAAPCLTYDDVFTDALLRGCGAIVDGVHPDLGALEQPGPFIRLDVTPAVLGRPAPALGGDSAAVLREAGFADERIATLVDAGVVGVSR